MFNKKISESLQGKSKEFVCRETSSSIRVDHTNLIIRPQAFSRLFLLNIIKQPKNQQSLTYRLMNPNKVETGLSLPKACGLMFKLV